MKQHSGACFLVLALLVPVRALRVSSDSSAISMPPNISLYFMHLPKAAGDSFVGDAPKYCHREFPGSESNFCRATSGLNGTQNHAVVAMVRDPRAHVLSMYFHCKTGHEYSVQGWDARMPDRIVDWLRPWSQVTSTDMPELLHRFCCYNPVNLQSSRFSCSGDLREAKRNLKRAYFVGLVEHYHLSLCLLGLKVSGRLHERCHCSARTDMEKSMDNHMDHGVQTHSVSHLPASHLELIDNITREDAEIYELVRTRLADELVRAERKFQVKIICDGERQALNTPRASRLQQSILNHPPRPPPRPPVKQEQATTRTRMPPRPSPSPGFAFPPGQLPPRPLAAGKKDVSLLSLGSTAARPSKTEFHGCPNEGYLLHGTR